MQYRPHQPFRNLPNNNQSNQFQNARPNNLSPRGGFHRGSNHRKFNSSGPFNYDGNEEHWCETCDRGFRTVDLLEKHKQQHQKCNIDGCQFIAHPKVVTIHIQMQHSTGLYKKIGNLNNPEDIRKWREERKKRYPTKENIEKKAAEVKEKLERGEKMGLREKRFNGNKNNTWDRDKKLGTGSDKRKNNYDPNNTRQNKARKISNDSKEKPYHPRKENNIKSILDNQRKLKPFAGIQDLLTDDDEVEQTEASTNNCLTDEEDTPQIKETTNSKKPEICGALSSLLCNYGSSDEEISKVAERKCVNLSIGTPKPAIELTKMNEGPSKIKDKSLSEKKYVPANEERDESNSAPEETSVAKAIENSSNVQDKPTKYSNNVKKHRPDQNRRFISKTKPKVPSTLLQKLLFKEMRQERNMVLQCIRYIVKNNYFNK